VRFFNCGGTPMTLSGGDDLLQHRGIRGKVRHDSVEVEEATQMELTKVGERRWRWLRFSVKSAAALW
jgi:hypothetical protein